MMPNDTLLQYSEYLYAAVIIAVLIYILFRIGKRAGSANKEITPDKPVTPETNMEPPIAEPAQRNILSPDPRPWWDQEDFPYSAPWWFRYPASICVFAGSYWAFFEWGEKAGWILGGLLSIIGLGLVRELLIGALIAAAVGGVLWMFGAAFAALPVSAAIIIGAMIIAQAVRR